MQSSVSGTVDAQSGIGSRNRPTGFAAWRHTQSGREAVAFHLFLLPWILGMIIFQLGPMLASAVLVFFKYDILSPPVWIGLGNFDRLVNDHLFYKSLSVTAYYTIFAVPLSIMVGYLVALLLNQGMPGLSIWRTAYYLPSVVPGVAIAYLWMWILDPYYGVANMALESVGIKGPAWLGSEEWVIPSFLVMTLWGACGGMILYLAAMQQVPRDLYDAAHVDGANAWHRFRHVTLPMTSFVVFFTFITGVIGTFQVFGAGYIMTNGGPTNASLFYVLYLYRQAWVYANMGYGAVLSWVLFVIVLLLTLIIFKYFARRVYYAGDEGGR